MNQRREYQAIVDEQGRLVLPPELSARLGLTPGVTVHIDEVDQSWYLRRPITRLDKVYIEPTSLCNLTCRTCIRNVWDEPTGQMSAATFGCIVGGLREFPLPLTVFFGGFGEPLFHPDIVGMVEAVKALGARVELITNGTLLTEERARHLIAVGLDMLWVSLDGATPASYTDVRLGAQLPEVLANVDRFRSLRPSAQLPAPEIGIVFVALERNFADLPDLLRLARRLGATRFMVSNVLPHTPEMRREVLYAHAMSNDIYFPSPRQPDLFLPKMDAERLASPALYEAVCGQWNLNFSGVHLTSSSDRCPFIEAGATAIGWDGGVSPCLSLLHDHPEYLHGRRRDVREYIVGNIHDTPLSEIWQSPRYVAFRERLRAFPFSPCTTCGGCERFPTNFTDCRENTFPVCGACLWAQGFVQCP